MLEIRLFGLPQVLIDGATLQGARTRPVEWLLALLALRAGEPVARSWLAGSLWPDSSESQALLNLRISLMRLRDLLGSEADLILTPNRRTLQLDLNGARVDVAEFDTCIARGDEASLRRAAGLYTGPLLEGCDREWILGERERRSQQCLSALEKLAESALSRGEARVSLEDWRRAVAMDWTRDSAQRGLMLAMEACSDSPAALLAYRDFRVRLWDEMGLEPDPETAALYNQIKGRARQGAGSSRQEAGGRKQAAVISDQSPDLVNPKSKIQNPKSLLPTPLTALIGREAEAEAVSEAARSNRLVTLVGAGGIGKTRLSIEVARQLCPEFGDEVAFVELARLTDSSQLIGHLASCLGVEAPASAEASDATGLAGVLSGHKALIVLDNCEHLVRAAASLAQDLLERYPLLHILATSRERLGVTGERIRRVSPLALPDPSARGESVLRSPAVQLFLERAAMARPGFRLAGRADATAAGRICQRLDGIPLAIELAAARIGVLSMDQIADRLDDRFRLLTAGSRAALPRHQTLQALIDWSYDLLNEEEQALLRYLSVFVGGWTLEAAEQVSSEWLVVSGNGGPQLTTHSDVLDLLASLSDKSLVQQDDGGPLSRYRMLETIREYAREQLRHAGEEEDARRRQLVWALALAECAGRDLLGSNPDATLDRLEAEIDNLRAALAYAECDNAPADCLLRLAAALWPFWEMRGYIPEGRSYLRAALDRPVPSDSPARAHALLGAAVLALEQRSQEESLAYAGESLERFRTLDYAAGAAAALLHLGYASLLMGNMAAAHAWLTDALARSREAEWVHGRAIVLVHLWLAEQGEGDGGPASTVLDEALSLMQKADDPQTPSYCLNYLGAWAPQLSASAKARSLLERFLEIARRMGQRRSAAVMARALGEVASRQGQTTRALSYFQETADIYRGTGNTYPLAYTLQDMGNLHYRWGDYKAACAIYTESLDLFRRLGPSVGLDTACNNLGSTLFHLGEPDGARQLHREALGIYSQNRNLEGIAWSLERLGIVEAKYGPPEYAVQILAAAESVRRETVARSTWDQVDRDEAVSHLREALADPEIEKLLDAANLASWQPTVDQILSSP